ncbi:glycosyltransferase [Candidatus Latescibacterota bacterium]
MNERVFHVPAQSGFWGKHYSLSLSKLKQEAAKLLRGADLICCHMLYRYHIQWATSIARSAGIPYWIVPHGSLDPFVFTYRAWLKKLWLFFIGKRIIRQAKHVIVATERENENVLSLFGNVNTCIVHWPVTNVDTSKRTNLRAKIRAKHNIPKNARVLLFLGRLHSIKQPLKTIDAFGIASDSNLHLIMAGPNDTLTKSECERYCTMHKISNVHIVGPIFGSEKYDYYLGADAFISLSYKENFGYTIVEALACGIPVILSPGIGLTIEFAKVNCGWILDSTDIKAVSFVLKQFSQASQDTLIEMGRRGQHWVQRELSSERFSKTLRKLIIEDIKDKKY